MTEADSSTPVVSQYENIGFVAAVMTSVALFPQAYRIYKTGKTEDLSLATYTTYTWGLVLWLVYAFLEYSRPTIYSSIVSLVPALYIAWKVHDNNHKNQKRKR